MKHLFLSCLALLLFTSLSAQRLDKVQGEILVKPAKEKNIEAIISKYNNFEGKKTQARNSKYISRNVDIYLMSFDHTKINEADLLAALRKDPLVETAQYNHLVQMRQTTPNDPQLGSQWQWVNPNDADVDAELAWDITTGGTTTQGDEIVVAVLDDGTDLTHPDLIANHWTNTAEIPNNNIDDDNNGYVDDFNGWSIITDDDNVSGGSHGVNVSGMIGAVGNNGTGGTGINWDVKIMMVKNNFNTNEAAVLEAYDYPLTFRKAYNDTNGAEGAYVVATNASWGIDGGDPNDAPLWCAFYDTLGDEGILNCGATSNSNINVDQQGDLPTTCPSDYMVAVTRTDINDNQFGGFGPIHIDVGAPGQNIFTTAAGGGYTSTTGTSFACPLTAGIIALMYSVPCDDLITLSKTNPAAAAIQVRNHLYNGVDPTLPGLTATGGRVNAFNSCQLVLGNCGPPTCTDNVMNQDETGVDCGGATCPVCPTCTDGIQNQDETGVDCGGVCAACPCLDTEVTLTLNFDDYPEETSWTITDASSIVVASGGTYPTEPDGSTLTEQFCLPDGCYDFTINDAFGDGICCGFGNGSYILTDDTDGVTLASGGEFDSSETTNFCVENISNACVTDLTLSGVMTSVTKTENASNSITSTESIVSTSDITYEAGNYIDLNPGFQVLLGNDFLAHIVSCVSNISDNTPFELVVEQDIITNNSSTNKKNIAFELTNISNITIVIADYFGNVVKTISVEELGKGVYTRDIDFDELDGSYKVVVLKGK